MTFSMRIVPCFAVLCATLVLYASASGSTCVKPNDGVSCFHGSRSVFDLPAGANILFKDDSGKTWRQNGIVTGAVQTVQGAFSNQLVKAKFKCKHVIPLEEKTGRVLEEWRKGDQSLLLMLWPGENGMTMFSWGISNE